MLRSNGADGRGAIGGSFGGELQLKAGDGVQILDNFNVTRGIVFNNALYSSPINPQSLQSFVTLRQTQLKLTGITGITASLTTDGSAVPLAQNVLEAETRYLRQAFHDASNEIHLSVDVFPGNTVTFGHKISIYDINLLSYTGGDILLQAQDNPTPVQVSLTNGTTNYQLTNAQGFVNGATGLQSASGSGVNNALFISDSWKFGGFLLDLGGRGENQSFNEYLQNTASTNLTGNATDLWGTGRYLTGTGSTRYHFNQLGFSWTAGLNYTFSDRFSAYVRANKGVHFLSMSDVLGLPVNNYGPLQTAHNYQRASRLTQTSCMRTSAASIGRSATCLFRSLAFRFPERRQPALARSSTGRTRRDCCIRSF